MAEGARTAGTCFPHRLVKANWSGYVVSAGPFTSVSGTFKVPFLYNDGSCADGLSNWVGIDGTGDTGLVQAGVQETYSNPSTGHCNPSASFWVEDAGDRWSGLELPRSTKVTAVMQKEIVQDARGASSPSSVFDLADLLVHGFTDSYTRDEGS
jgi:Peptidase A4 family